MSMTIKIVDYNRNWEKGKGIREMNILLKPIFTEDW